MYLGNRIFLSFILLCLLFYRAKSSPYNVHWLGGPTTIERDNLILKRPVDVYCYTGTSKNLLALWQTVRLHIKIKNDEFRQYIGDNPEDVFKAYTEDSYGWSVVNPFTTRTQKSLSLNLFTPTCMAINTKERHTIDFQVQRVDLWRVMLMLSGVALIFLSRALSGNPLFFYLCGILVGVFASFMVLVYYVSRLLPKKTLTYGILIGGWTVGVYLFQQMWDNIRHIVTSYQTYAFWYTLVVAFCSFLVCYRIGPPRNQRSKNLVMWTLQSVGVLKIFFSSEYQEASAAVVVLTLTVNYFPAALTHRIRGYWRRKFPPKQHLLSNEEYYEEGARETKMALEQLRKHCASPDCAQWSIMLRLNDSKRARTPNQRGASNMEASRLENRFASFVEGNSHLSDDEVMNYESYAFSMDRGKEPVANSTRNYGEISDDDDGTDYSDY